MFLSKLRSTLKLRSTRTMASIATLQRMTAKSLSEKILEEREAKDPTFAIIDVRDDGKAPFCPSFLIARIYLQPRGIMNLPDIQTTSGATSSPPPTSPPASSML